MRSDVRPALGVHRAVHVHHRTGFLDQWVLSPFHYVAAQPYWVRADVVSSSEGTA
jgi:hypothetical protein